MPQSLNQYLPHGVCLSWEPGLLWLHVASNLTIALAYFSIPFALATFVRKRIDLAFKPVFLMFALFIMSCGFTHVMEVWVLWFPNYWLDGSIKALTALLSIATAAVLWPLLPRLLKLPSPMQLQTANEAMQKEMAQRVDAEEALRRANVALEHRVASRTEELVELNRKLVGEIEERRRAEESVRELNAKLEERVGQRTQELSESVRELEAFSYTVAHDLRAPLRAIGGYATLVVRDHGTGLGEVPRALLGRIATNIQRLGQLIDDLLAFAKIGRSTLRLSPVDMHGLALSVAGELGRDYPGTRVQVGELAPAHADATLIEQVLRNLLSNAIKFSSGREAPLVQVESARQEGRTVYTVKDNGVGFDMRYADKLFGVFQRLHDSEEFPGTGIGLATVQRIVRRHGGSVQAEGSPGGGATFGFSVPD